MIPSPQRLRPLIVLLMAVVMVFFPSLSRAGWEEDFEADHNHLGVDFAVRNALVNGAAPHALLQVMLHEPYFLLPRLAIKAMFCARVAESLIANASTSLGIPPEEYQIGRQESIVECGFLPPIHDFNGDGLHDEWQRQFFGSITAIIARPDADPDGDGQNNLFEYHAGLIPTDPRSVFTQAITKDPDDPSRIRFSFHPRRPNRNYRILTSTSLAAQDWTPHPGGEVADDGETRILSTPIGPGRRFFRVEIQAP